MEYGCIGERLVHSFSKEIHNKLFDYDYNLKELTANEVKKFFKKRDFKAINVTIPYKEKVIPYVDEVSDIAKKIGAINTVVNRDGKLYGFNTDFLGLKSLLQKSGIKIQNKKVLILGSGGTSKTALAVAEDGDCAGAYIVSRKKAEGYITYDEAIANHTDAQVIINTTPCGMYPNLNESVIDITCFENLEGVVDVVYNPLKTKLVCDALNKGVKATGGLYMLVAQAVFAAEKFLDKKIDTQVIDKVYKNILSQKQNIVLVGMPGSGKTTVGKLLAKKLGMDFIDTDIEIEQLENSTIPFIFENKGESYFRKVETQVIERISALQGTVIATGGGAVLNENNINMLKQNGSIYFLDRPLENIVATSNRPLSSTKQDLEKRYKERYEIYLKASDNRIFSNSTAEDTVLKIEENFCK